MKDFPQQSQPTAIVVVQPSSTPLRTKGRAKRSQQLVLSSNPYMQDQLPEEVFMRKPKGHSSVKREIKGKAYIPNVAAPPQQSLGSIPLGREIVSDLQRKSERYGKGPSMPMSQTRSSRKMKSSFQIVSGSSDVGIYDNMGIAPINNNTRTTQASQPSIQSQTRMTSFPALPSDPASPEKGGNRKSKSHLGIQGQVPPAQASQNKIVPFMSGNHFVELPTTSSGEHSMQSSFDLKGMTRNNYFKAKQVQMGILQTANTGQGRVHPAVQNSMMGNAPTEVVFQSMSDLAPFKEKKLRHTGERKKGPGRQRIEQTTSYGFRSQASATRAVISTGGASAAVLVEALHSKKPKEKIQNTDSVNSLPRQSSGGLPKSKDVLPSDFARVNSDMIDDYKIQQDIKFIEKKNRKVMVTYLAKHQQKQPSVGRKSNKRSQSPKQKLQEDQELFRLKSSNSQTGQQPVHPFRRVKDMKYVGGGPSRGQQLSDSEHTASLNVNLKTTNSIIDITSKKSKQIASIAKKGSNHNKATSIRMKQSASQKRQFQKDLMDYREENKDLDEVKKDRSSQMRTSSTAERKTVFRPFSAIKRHKRSSSRFSQKKAVKFQPEEEDDDVLKTSLSDFDNSSEEKPTIKDIHPALQKRLSAGDQSSQGKQQPRASFILRQNCIREPKPTLQPKKETDDQPYEELIKSFGPSVSKVKGSEYYKQLSSNINGSFKEQTQRAKQMLNNMNQLLRVKKKQSSSAAIGEQQVARPAGSFPLGDKAVTSLRRISKLQSSLTAVGTDKR